MLSRISVMLKSHVRNTSHVGRLVKATGVSKRQEQAVFAELTLRHADGSCGFFEVPSIPVIGPFGREGNSMADLASPVECEPLWHVKHSLEDKPLVSLQHETQASAGGELPCFTQTSGGIFGFDFGANLRNQWLNSFLHRRQHLFRHERRIPEMYQHLWVVKRAVVVCGRLAWTAESKEQPDGVSGDNCNLSVIDRSVDKLSNSCREIHNGLDDVAQIS